MVREFESEAYWALILGGSTGLGLASAKKLAAHGMNICIVHRNSRTEMEEISIEFDAIKSLGVDFASFNMDILSTEKRSTSLTELKELLGGNSKIKCMLHSIAKGSLKAMAAEPLLATEDFMITMQNMAFSLYNWTSAVFHAELFAPDARILAFTSEGSKKAMKHYVAVSAAKAALEAISRSIALEFAPYGIRSNCIQAGITDTRSLRMIPGSDALIDHSMNRNPFRRLTLPQDVADVVYLLCKDESAWINGAIIPVDGGEQIC